MSLPVPGIIRCRSTNINTSISTDPNNPTLITWRQCGNNPPPLRIWATTGEKPVVTIQQRQPNGEL